MSWENAFSVMAGAAILGGGAYLAMAGARLQEEASLVASVQVARMAGWALGGAAGLGAASSLAAGMVFYGKDAKKQFLSLFPVVLLLCGLALFGETFLAPPRSETAGTPAMEWVGRDGKPVSEIFPGDWTAYGIASGISGAGLALSGLLALGVAAFSKQAGRAAVFCSVVFVCVLTGMTYWLAPWLDMKAGTLGLAAAGGGIAGALLGWSSGAVARGAMRYARPGEAAPDSSVSWFARSIWSYPDGRAVLMVMGVALTATLCAAMFFPSLWMAWSAGIAGSVAAGTLAPWAAFRYAREA
jgi:hypothetical protein